jgi:predicted glycoside hydrolase/deacetylase ChbG (UPF0249 family)
MADRRLIVNADDFGRCRLINAGLIEAHERGIVTSASLMCRWPGAAEAARYGSRRPALGLGLHLDLGEWLYREGDWTPAYEVVDLEDGRAVESEMRGQLAAFRELVGRDPTHLDSHQHVHRFEPVASLALQLSQEIGVPLRTYDARIGYCGDFYGRTREGRPLHQAITVQALIDLVRALPEGVTELACHPGEGSQTDREYAMERQLEVRALTDFRVRAALDREGIRLCSLADFA